VKFDFHPTLRQPAISRYAATTPKNLQWFDSYNSEKPYPKQVKPFGFVSALYARNLAISSENETPGQSNKKQPASIRPVAPFENDPRRIGKVAFDRLTGLAVLPGQLKSYQDALAQYHLHPEDKFLDGDFLDRGTTQRRHVRAVQIQYIGKESNKWEEQYYLGLDPEEEIRYGTRPAKRKSVAMAVRRIVDKLGLRAAAKELGISRWKLAKLLENGFLGCPPEFTQRICGIVGRINSRLNRENGQNSELVKLAKAEICKIGISEFARRLRLDPANLSKTIEGKRPLSASTHHRLSRTNRDV
jgi:hypothetical protein